MYGITVLQNTEHAGRNLATLARSVFFDGAATGRNVLVVAGPGGNGDGGLSATRQLHNLGANVTLMLTAP